MSASREKQNRQAAAGQADPKTAREAQQRKEEKRTNLLYGVIAAAVLIALIVSLVWRSDLLPKMTTAATIDGEKYTLLEALAMERYGKVYLSLGVNELGYNNDKGYYEKFCAAVDEVRRVQPNAVIYIQSLIPVNEAQYLAATGHDYLTNDHLRIYNQLMQQVAEEKKVAYVNVYEAFADENGSLPEGDSRDGVHLYKESCQRWLEYLRTHTVEFDTLYPDGPPPVEVPDPEPAGPDTSTADGSGQG